MIKYLFLTFTILFSSKAFAVDPTDVFANNPITQTTQPSKQETANVESLKEKMAAMLGTDQGVEVSKRKVDSDISQENSDRGFLPRAQKVVLPKNAVSATTLAKNSPLRAALNDAYDAYKNENVEVALTYYKKANQLDDKNIDALFGLGASYQLLGQSDDAIKAYVKVLEIDPDYYPAKNNMIILISGNSAERAIKELMKINEKHPNNAFVLAQIGTLFSYSEKYNDAIFYLGKAIENEPSNPFYAYNMAVTFDQMKKYKEAYNYYDHSLSLITSSTLLDKNVIYERMTFLRSCIGVK